MKVATIVGARPQFIKAWPVSLALRKAGLEEFLIHTGQHYDFKMSRIFFEELDIPGPEVNLEIGSGPQGRQTGQMLAKIEEILIEQNPDRVLVYGDTNSTLAGALAAVKLHIRVAHVEAGLRSFNRRMPEEHNRVLTDHCSDLLLCPTSTAVDNLTREGITEGVHLVGDVMHDALLKAKDIARQKSGILERLQLTAKTFLLATVHRAENTDDPKRLRSILTAFEFLAREQPIIFLVHPRTRQRIEDLQLVPVTSALRLLEPVGYLDMLRLEESARVILTDSGGIQKEAFWLRTPCVTLREETEWIETVAAGWNWLAGTEAERIILAVAKVRPWQTAPEQEQRESVGHIMQLLTSRY